MKGTGVAQ